MVRLKLMHTIYICTRFQHICVICDHSVKAKYFAIITTYIVINKICFCIYFFLKSHLYTWLLFSLSKKNIKILVILLFNKLNNGFYSIIIFYWRLHSLILLKGRYLIHGWYHNTILSGTLLFSFQHVYFHN